MGMNIGRKNQSAGDHDVLALMVSGFSASLQIESFGVVFAVDRTQANCSG